MNDYTIEFPLITDLDDLLILWEKSVRATHHFLKKGDVAIYKKLLRNEFFKNVNLYCIFLDGEVVGFIGTASNDIKTLFIDPSHFCKGMGKALVEHAVDHLDCRNVTVNEKNTDALSFYSKMGFKPVSRSLKDGFGKPYPSIRLRIDKKVELN